MTGHALDELDFEYATEVAEKAVRSMSQHRIPPTPNNFHTWFKYSLGTSSGLKRAIDILVGNKRKFDATTNHDLFAAFVGPQTAADDTTSSTTASPGTVSSGLAFLTYSLTPTIQGIAINPIFRTAALADPNATANQITFINSLDQSFTFISLF